MLTNLICVENSRVDPNDPRNAQLLQLIDSIPDSSEQANYFQLVNVEEVQRYISEEQFCRNKRFTMLCLRDDGVRKLFVDFIFYCCYLRSTMDSRIKWFHSFLNQ